MSDEKFELKTIEGYLSFDGLKKEIKRMGELIANYEPEKTVSSVILMNMRIESMYSLLSLYKKYSNNIETD